MSRPVSRYRPSRRYLLLALLALIGAAGSFWAGARWSAEGWNLLAYLASGGFTLTAAALLVLATRPVIEIHEDHLKIGARTIPWVEIRAVDQTGWLTPLGVRLEVEEEESLLIVYPGDLESSASLLRQLRRYSRLATIDGVPHRQYWGEPVPGQKKGRTPVRYPVLRPEDEQDVERMYRKLKAEGRIDEHAPGGKIGEK